MISYQGMWVNSLEPAKLDQRLRPQWREWFDRQPAGVRQALTEYKSMSHGLFVLARGASREPSEEDLARWAGLDQAFDNARWPQDTLLWRGFRAWSLDDSEPEWAPPATGTRAEFEMWTSTSLSELYAANEAYPHMARDNEHSVIYEILLPRGHPAIYMEAVRAEPTHESEVLLPRGTTYTVDGVERTSALRTVPRERYRPFHNALRIRLSLTR